MPSSPLMRISPKRMDLKSEKNHKRRHSLGGGICEKEDDLALFNEVQNRERDNFLLQSNDDFDDIFSSKLRYFSAYNHGISIPKRGETSDLLNVEGDKNDYDWLITPPETPLFTSLDDDTSKNNLSSREGRPRTQPISVSRSSTMEKGYGSSNRGSPSPRRLSTSPKSFNSSPQPRISNRPFPAPHSSPPLSLRSSSPSRKPSQPPRTSASSSSKANRGSSDSPKMKAWKDNIQGFSSEAPTNLRTSLGDGPVSYVRGSSPAALSRNGSKLGRQSMSPTASRSIGSSHSNEKASSFKKGSKVLSTSAPKRSFDASLRQIERKGPQNMFRPMLSSVPSATMYDVKGSYLTSVNSSITTSSNASSEQGTSGAVAIEENGQNQEEVSCENKHGEQVFVLDQVDALNEGDEYEMRDESSVCEHDKIDGCPPLDKMHEDRNVDDLSDMELCSTCGQRFQSGEVEREGLQLCRECSVSRAYSTVTKSENVEAVSDKNAIVLTLEDMSQSNSFQESEQVSSTTKTGEDIDTYVNKEVELTHSAEQVATKTSANNSKDLQLSVNSSNSNDISEGSGISLLLKSSNSSRRGYVVQSRSNVSYDELSYVRDSINSMRSSVGFSSNSASLSSSVDLGSSKQMEARIHRQLSGLKSDNGLNVAYTDNELSVASEAESESTCTVNLTSIQSRDELVDSNVDFEEQENCKTSTNESNDNTMEEEDTSSSGHVQGQDAVPSLCEERICDEEIENGDIETRTNVDPIDFETPAVEDDRSDAFHEESTVVFEGLNGKKSKSMSLEEAADAILFCRSIVHDIACEAADIAIEKERSPTMEAVHLRTSSTYIGNKSKLERREARQRSSGKRGFKSQKAIRQRKLENNDAKAPVIENGVPTNPILTATVLRKGGDSAKPPMKLESKCNCIIM